MLPDGLAVINVPPAAGGCVECRCTLQLDGFGLNISYLSWNWTGLWEGVFQGVSALFSADFSTFSLTLNRPQPGRVCLVRQGFFCNVGVPVLWAFTSIWWGEARRICVVSVATTVTQTAASCQFGPTDIGKGGEFCGFSVCGCVCVLLPQFRATQQNKLLLKSNCRRARSGEVTVCV